MKKVTVFFALSDTCTTSTMQKNRNVLLRCGLEKEYYFIA